MTSLREIPGISIKRGEFMLVGGTFAASRYKVTPITSQKILKESSGLGTPFYNLSTMGTLFLIKTSWANSLHNMVVLPAPGEPTKATLLSIETGDIAL